MNSLCQQESRTLPPATAVSGIIVDSSYTTASTLNPSNRWFARCDTHSFRQAAKDKSTSNTPRQHHHPQSPNLNPSPSFSIELILPAKYLTNTPKDNPLLLSIAPISLLGATIVVDECQHALGLVYSSAESVAESIHTGTGVYQSLEHGLWSKGATSGAT
jgi:phosphoribosyl-AMP cyclohydrolase